jgi:hypothetical protein
MSTPTKFLLDESRMPRHWYNIMADLPVPRRRRCTRARCSRWGPTTWRRCSRWN